MTQPWVSRASASLGAGSVVLVEGSSFCISLPSGDVVPDRPQGLFFRDTRFLSELRVRINECWPEPLAAHTTEPFAATFVLRDCPPPGRAASELLLVRRRYVGRGLREDVTLHNFDTKTVRCVLELDIDADFADVFEVKEGRVAQDRAHSLRSGERSLEFTYRHGSFNRATTVTLSQVPQLRERTARYELAIPPGAEWSTCVQVTPVLDRQPVTPRYRCGEPVEQSRPSIRLAEWRRDRPVITSDVDPLDQAVARSVDDLGALRIFDPDYPERTVVAAGAPWFMTLFGRDSLITSWMALPIDPDLAFGTLQTLARFQGHRVNPVTEEQPGRILHEMRFGENATLSLGGGRVYYGSVDASPLFVMLLAELRRWGHRRGELDALLLAADAALTWIDEYGDADGDGYLEYERAADHGLRNQSWKDSWDAVRFADGRPAERDVRGAGIHVRRAPRACQLRRRRRRRSSRREPAHARRRPQAAVQPRLLAARPRVVRDGTRPPQDADRRAHLQYRPLPVDGHRRRRQGGACRRPPRGQRLLLGVGSADGRHDHVRVQPDQLPQRQRLAARQRADRSGARALRPRRAGTPRHARHRRGGCVLRPPPPRAVRGTRAGRPAVSRPLSDVVLAAGLGGGDAVPAPAHGARPAARRARRHGPLAASGPRVDGVALDRPATGRGRVPVAPRRTRHVDGDRDAGPCHGRTGRRRAALARRRLPQRIPRLVRHRRRPARARVAAEEAFELVPGLSPSLLAVLGIEEPHQPGTDADPPQPSKHLHRLRPLYRRCTHVPNRVRAQSRRGVIHSARAASRQGRRRDRCEPWHREGDRARAGGRRGDRLPHRTDRGRGPDPRNGPRDRRGGAGARRPGG